MKCHRSAYAAVLILLGTTAGANAEDYVVRWAAVEHDINPIRQTVLQEYVAHFARSGDRFITDEGGQVAETGAEEPGLFVTKLGTQHSIVYTGRGDEIVRTDTFPGFSFVMIIRSDGQGGCKAQIRYHKKGNAAVFESKRYDGGGASSAARVEATNVECKVTAPLS